MLLDVSSEGSQRYVEDCEVCCNPLVLEFEVRQGELNEFDCAPAQ